MPVGAMAGGGIDGLCRAELARALPGTPIGAGWRDVAARWEALGRPVSAARPGAATPAPWRPVVRGPTQNAAPAWRAGSCRQPCRVAGGRGRTLARQARIVLEEAGTEGEGVGAVAGAAPAADSADVGLARYGLTEREVEVLRLVADGRSNQQIGDALFISRKTASVHVSNILGKLGVGSRIEAAAVAHRLGLSGDPGPSG
jgi:DNA-binding CsgD family transcriptional regulator